MKKTKRNIKKNLIILATIILVVLLIWFIITKTHNKNTTQEVTTPTTTTTNTHEGIISLEIVWPEEEPKDEKRTYAPAEIKAISEKNGTTYLTLDMMTLNPNFQPGVNDYFLNQNSKLRELAIDTNTKAFNCDNTTPTISVPLTNVIDIIHQWLTNNNERLTYFFDIEDGKINTIYQQCLP